MTKAWSTLRTEFNSSLFQRRYALLRNDIVISMKPPIEDLAAAQPPSEASDHPPVLELAGRCMYVTGERDLARSERDLVTGRLQTAQAEVLRLTAKLADLRTALTAERDAAIKANEAMEQMERDLYLRLNKVEAERNAARWAAEDWETTAGEYERWRDVALEQVAELQAEVRLETERRRVASEERDREREIAETWEARFRALVQPPIGPQCEGHKPKQCGPATFVVRRCKLVDGHDGQCEPA